MTNRQGPAKQLAPVMSLESACPHKYIEDEGLHLEIECSSCAGAHDLDNAKCLSGVLNVVALGASPETIILKRFVHKRYRGERVAMVSRLANILASMNRALAGLEPLSDKRCRTCPARPERVLRELRRRLLEEPSRFERDPVDVVRAFTATLPLGGCERSIACIRSALESASLNDEVA